MTADFGEGTPGVVSAHIAEDAIKNAAAVMKFIEFYNSADYQRLAELTGPRFVWHSIRGEQRIGISAYIERQSERPIDQRYTVDMEEIIAAGDRVVVRLHIHINGSTFLRTHDIYHVIDGLIEEEWSGHA